LDERLVQFWCYGFWILGTLIANTDTRWYLNFTKNIYRFSAVRMDEADTSRFHGHDERISVESYFNVNNFYYRLMQNAEEDVRDARFGSLRKEGEL
jgi:carboxypeptidase PM20D1